MNVENYRIADFWITKITPFQALHARKCFALRFVELRLRREFNLKHNLGLCVFGLDKHGEPVAIINCLLLYGGENISNFFKRWNQGNKELIAKVVGYGADTEHYKESVMVLCRFICELKRFYKTNGFYRVANQILGGKNGTMESTRKSKRAIGNAKNRVKRANRIHGKRD